MDLWKRRWIGQKLRQDQFRQEIIEGIIMENLICVLLMFQLYEDRGYKVHLKQ